MMDWTPLITFLAIAVPVFLFYKGFDLLDFNRRKRR